MQMKSFTFPDLNEGFVVAITIEAKPGEDERIAGVLKKLVQPTNAEPGVKLFLPYRSPTNSHLFFIFELYVDEAAWGAHQATEHFKEAVAELVAHTARRERTPFLPYDFPV